MSRYQPTALDLLDDEPPAPADWPILSAGYSYGVARPFSRGDLVHIWQKAGTQHRAACGATTTKGVLPASTRLGAVLCHQCRQAAPVNVPAPEPEAEAPLMTVDALDALPAAPAPTTPPRGAVALPALAPVQLDRIRTDGGTQARAGLNADTVAEYTAALEAGAFFPPVVVFHDGADYWLADGFHRVAAYKARGVEKAAITADVRQGTRRDAVLFAVGANATHGLRRTREDVRRAIDVLLRDAEWGKWSDREIARQVGCDHKTVAGVRERLASGGEIPHLTERQAPDGKSYPAERPPVFGTPPPSLVARAAALGLKLEGLTLSGGYLKNDAATFGGVASLERYLSEREKEVAPAQEVTGPAAALLNAGWLIHNDNPLYWKAPTPDAQGRYTAIEFDDQAELERAAAIVAAEPDIGGDELAERLTIIAAAPAEPVSAFRTTCRTCGAPFTNGQFAGQCGPCYRGEAKAPAPTSDDPTNATPAPGFALTPPPEPAPAPVDGIPLDVRVLAEAHGLLMESAAPQEEGFYLYWPWEKDQTDAFVPFNAEWAREWMMSDGPMGAERIPESLYSRALAAGWFIVGAHAEGRLIVMPTSDDTHTVTEELTPSELEARIGPPAALPEPEPAAPVAPPARVTPAPGETVARAVEANRSNPAWGADAQQIGELYWELGDALGETDQAGVRPGTALHLARQLVALLELETNAPADYQTPLVYRRVAEFERGAAVLPADLSIVQETLEDLAGTLDDVSYEDLAARLSAVRGRGKAAA